MVSNEAFSEIMGMLQEVYDKKLNVNTLKLYKLIFDKNFNDEQFKEASYKLIETRVYPTFPKVGEFLEVVKPTKLDLDGQALIAANKLKKAIRGIGKYESVAFDDYMIHKVIKASYGTWVKICKLDMEELETFLKWDFPKLYKTYSTYKSLDDLPIYLTGTHEASNLALDYKPTIKYIGDKEKALKWQNSLFKNNKLIDNDKLIALGFKGAVKLLEKKEIDVKKLIEEGKEMFKVDVVEKKRGPIRTKAELIKILEG